MFAPPNVKDRHVWAIVMSFVHPLFASMVHVGLERLVLVSCATRILIVETGRVGKNEANPIALVSTAMAIQMRSQWMCLLYAALPDVL